MCSDVSSVSVARGHSADICIPNDGSINHVSLSGPAFGSLQSRRLEAREDGTFTVRPDLDDSLCFAYTAHAFIPCSHQVSDTLTYTVYSYSGDIRSCHVDVNVTPEGDSSLRAHAVAPDPLSVYEQRDILPPIKLSVASRAESGPEEYKASLTVRHGLLSAVLPGHTQLRSADLAPKGAQRGTPTLHMEGTLLDINRRLALLYYTQPAAKLLQRGADELVLQLRDASSGGSGSSGKVILQRAFPLHIVAHPQLESVRFSPDGAEVRLTARQDITSPGHGQHVPCSDVFTSDTAFHLDAQTCRVAGNVLTAKMGPRARVAPGDNLDLAPGALVVAGVAADGNLPVANALAPQPCRAVISQASASLCAGLTGYARVASQSHREPAFIWDTSHTSCALRSHVAAQTGRELVAPPELLAPRGPPDVLREIGDVELQATCVNFMGQYGDTRTTSLSVVADAAPRGRILMPDVVKTIAGYDIGVTASVTEPGLRTAGCVAVQYSQLSSRCGPDLRDLAACGRVCERRSRPCWHVVCRWLFEMEGGYTQQLGDVQGLVDETEIVLSSQLLAACDTSYTLSLETSYLSSQGATVTNRDSIEVYVACQALVAAVHGGSNVNWLPGAPALAGTMQSVSC